MKKLILILLLAICAACTPNKNNMVDFTYAGNLPVVGDTINTEVVHFIIDSGANLSLLDSDYYEANKGDLEVLKSVEMSLYGISGVADYRTSATVVMHTSIGRCVFQESDLSPVVKKANSYGYNVIGIIGSDFLRDDYIINYKTKQLIHATE